MTNPFYTTPAGRAFLTYARALSCAIEADYGPDPQRSLVLWVEAGQATADLRKQIMDLQDEVTRLRATQRRTSEGLLRQLFRRGDSTHG